MHVGVLSSGGKDSTLAALVLEPFCEVTMLCGSFGVTDAYEHAIAAADAVGLSARKLELDPAVAEQAVTQIVSDGFPRNGIQQVHEHALVRAAQLDYDAIADGTRRGDRTPRVERPLAQRIEDKYDCSHIAPLAGMGRRTVDAFVSERLRVETGPSAQLDKGDYESELRVLIASEYSSEKVETLFPEHTQSRVVGRR